jgi:hypothetical protein
MPEAAAIGVIVSDLQRSVGPSLPIGAPSGGYRVAIAFERDSREDVDHVYGELLDAGGAPHKGPWDAFWGQRYGQVKDPHGTVIDLFRPTRSSATRGSEDEAWRRSGRALRAERFREVHCLGVRSSNPLRSLLGRCDMAVVR